MHQPVEIIGVSHSKKGEVQKNALVFVSDSWAPTGALPKGQGRLLAALLHLEHEPKNLRGEEDFSFLGSCTQDSMYQARTRHAHEAGRNRFICIYF